MFKSSSSHQYHGIFPKKGYINICLQIHFGKYYSSSIKQKISLSFMKAEVLNLLSEKKRLLNDWKCFITPFQKQLINKKSKLSIQIHLNG